MKKRILNVFTIVAIGFALVACKNKADEAKTTAAEDAATANAASVKYAANAAESVIEWTGFKPTGKHNGTINVESGTFRVNDGKIESGTFLIDMKSITVLDIPADDEYNAKLTNHLKNPDFFDVEQFANAAFEVTGFEEKEGKTWLSGNLTIKDKKNNVTFPVTVSDSEGAYSITSEVFTIDRSKWDIKYKSKSFFENLGDKFINDDIELKLSLKATKA